MFNKAKKPVSTKSKLDLKSTQLEKLQSFVFPLMTLAIIVGLSATVGKSMVERLFEIRDNMKELTAKNGVLGEKKQILNGLNEGDLTAGVRASTLAIPQEGPVLPAFVAIRSVALTKGLSINNVRFSGSVETSSNLRVVNFTFDTRGTLEGTIGFLREIKTMAPLTRVQKVKFAVSEGTVTGSITVHSLWEPLPETFGKVDDPIDTIGAAEKELLTKMSELKTPTTNAPSTGTIGGRKNPFSF